MPIRAMPRASSSAATIMREWARLAGRARSRRAAAPRRDAQRSRSRSNSISSASGMRSPAIEGFRFIGGRSEQDARGCGRSCSSATTRYGERAKDQPDRVRRRGHLRADIGRVRRVPWRYDRDRQAPAARCGEALACSCRRGRYDLFCSLQPTPSPSSAWLAPVASGRGGTIHALLDVRIAAAEPPLDENGGDLGGLLRSAKLRRASTMRARRGGSGSNRRRLPSLSDAALCVERTQGLQLGAALLKAKPQQADQSKLERRGSVLPHAAQSSSRPARSAERISGSAKRGRLAVAARPTGDSRRRARYGRRGPGADRRRPRHAHGLEPGHADVGLEARHARQAAVDDDTHALDRDRRLGDRGREHHLAPAGGAGSSARPARLDVDRAVERRDLDRRIARCAPSAAPQRRRISPWPGRNARIEPGSPRSARIDRVRHLVLDARVGIAAEIARLDREGAAFARDHGRTAEQLARPARRPASPTSTACAGHPAGRAGSRARAQARGRHRASARGTRRTAPRRCRKARDHRGSCG